MCRQFYRLYPIANIVCSQLNWSQYKLLISIPNKDKREFYQLGSANNAWTKRELERQINSSLYERLLMSNDKESVLAIARKERIPQDPKEIIKDPMINDTVVKMTLPTDNKTILASQYQLYLPTQEQLIQEVNEVKNSLKSEE